MQPGIRETSKVLDFNLRTRVETFKGSGIWDEVMIRKSFTTGQTSALICDMWDKHWCRGATERVAAMAPVMNSVIEVARNNGVQIIHSPSETMSFYIDTPYRQRIVDMPCVVTPKPLEISTPPSLPIDDSDGGCDTGEKPWFKAWTRQHPAIKIMGDDVISDDGIQIYNFIRQRGIGNLIMMGVHTNMCVMNRSFGIKQMTMWGIRCILVRDLTDSMYNPERFPHVGHEIGTNLVIEYIEKYWCPTITSEDLMKSF